MIDLPIKSNEFISGGLFGVQESLQSMVPMLIIPFISNQQTLAVKLQKIGVALVMPFDDVTKELFAATISEMISEPKFKQHAVTVSTLLNDNLAQPMYEALYWTEYVIKTRGAKHLRAKSVNLSLWKYLMIDVALFYFSIFAISFLFWVLVIRFFIKRHRAKQDRKKFKFY